VGATDDRTLTIETWCPGCGQTNRVPMTPDSFSAWQLGDHIQDAAPYLTADEREQLISGMCPQCWNRMEESIQER
jgi:hypothetical protein